MAHLKKVREQTVASSVILQFLNSSCRVFHKVKEFAVILMDSMDRFTLIESSDINRPIFWRYLSAIAILATE